MPLDPYQGTAMHSLLAQASTLAQELAKARPGDLDRLREQAQDLIQVLDTEHPALAAMERVLGLIRHLADSGTEDATWFREQAQHLPAAVAAAGRTRRRAIPASARDADAWILEMFRATESAIPREALVEDFISRYRRERRIDDTERHRGPWLVVLEAETERDEVTGLRPLVGAGLYRSAFERRCADYLPHWRDDPFLAPVILEQVDIDGWYALAFGGSPFFDALLDTRRHLHGEPDYWINAVALPGDGRHPGRAVFTLYPNAGDPLAPEPPPLMRQDMRLLTVLGLAWRQLEHQVRALARVSEADRRDMINLIAPGLLHHELGYLMRTAYGQALEQFRLLQRLAIETASPQVDQAALYAYGIARLVLEGYRVTDVFNRLDKRAEVEDSTLQQVFSDLKLLLCNRLGNASTELTWDTETFERQQIHTDVVLLSQALLNVLTNALNALTEDDTAPPRRIQAAIERLTTTQITVSLVNNGPAVPVREARDIFRRGYTTRRQGHGQGLYLARLVAHYLGGELTLMESAALPAGFRTGFRISFDRRLQTGEGLSREAP